MPPVTLPSFSMSSSFLCFYIFAIYQSDVSIFSTLEFLVPQLPCRSIYLQVALLDSRRVFFSLEFLSRESAYMVLDY
jgi:hypothetical protein